MLQSDRGMGRDFWELEKEVLHLVLHFNFLLSHSPYRLSRVNCSLWDLDMSRDTKKGWIAAKKCVKHLFKVIDRFIIYLMLIHAGNWHKTCWWRQVELWSFLQFNVKKEIYVKSSSRFDFNWWILDTASLSS